jgi:predicted kinase
MKTLYIIRGLPGSGKTTLARELNACVCEADDYFMDQDDYIFDATKLSQAHEWCRNSVKTAMLEGYNNIAVSNTFSRKWEFQPYIDLAKEYGYRVTEITLSGELHENIHNVPAEAIEAMRQRWER